MLRLRTLGTLDLTRSDGSEVRAVLSQPRRTALLAYLAVATPRGFHRRDRLVALFWPEDDTERARSSLNHAIYFLRRELGDGVVVSRGTDDLGLNPELFWCDAAAFELALDRKDVAAALELYRGDLLPGFFPSRAEGFERWLEEERSRLRNKASNAAWTAAVENDARGELALAIHWGRRAVELAPFDEVGVCRLLTLLDRAGDRGGAVRCYQEFAERMAAELELTPAPETRALIEDIRSREHANGAVNGAGTGNKESAENGESGFAGAEAAPAAPQSIPSARPSVRRVWALAASATLLASVVLGVGVLALVRERVDPRSVHVASFVNRTADPALENLGRVAAERITQSLSSTGLLEALVPNGRSSKRRETTDVTLPGGALHLRPSTPAGTTVSGEYHLEGGRLLFQAWITDTRRNSVTWAVRPISVPSDSVGHALDEVGRRVTGGVAALNMPIFASWFPIAASPPTIEAFQEFAEAVALQSHGFDKDAVPHLRRAIALDSAFMWARLQLAYAYYNLFDQSPADSITAELNRHRERLNPLQRHWLSAMLAIPSEDVIAGYRAMHAAAEMAPDRFSYFVALWASRLGRWRETISALERLSPDNPHAGGPGAYWNLLTRAYHAKSDGERELRAARRARQDGMEPMDALAIEIRALASLGRVDAARALMDTALTLHMEQAPGELQVMVGISRKSSPGQLMMAAAEELRAHGNEDAAREALERALAWYRAQPPLYVRSETRPFEMARALYLARDWVAADSAFRAQVASDTVNRDGSLRDRYFITLGFRGTIAARRRDEATARLIMAKFDSLRPLLPQPRRVAGYWQGKISAILGDDERALSYIADVWGLQGEHGVHMDFDFESMWHSKAFLEFIRPKG